MKKTGVIGVTLNLTALFLLVVLLVDKEEERQTDTEQQPAQQAVSQAEPPAPTQQEALSQLSFIPPDILKNWSDESQAPEKTAALEAAPAQTKRPEQNITPLEVAASTQPETPLTALTPIPAKTISEQPASLEPLSASLPKAVEKKIAAPLTPLEKVQPKTQMAQAPIKPLNYKKPEPVKHRPVPAETKLEPSIEAIQAEPKIETIPAEPRIETVQAELTPTSNPAPSLTSLTPPALSEQKPSRTPLKVPSRSEIKEAQAVLEKSGQADGLAMTFYWPQNEGVKTRIHKALKNCYGMRLGHLNHNGQLYFSKTKKATKAELNFYSPMLRLVGAPVDSKEAEALRRFGSASAGQMVRLFPRRLDAYILASLKQALPPHEELKGQFTGVYKIKAGKAILSQLKLNGRLLDAEITLPASQMGCI